MSLERSQSLRVRVGKIIAIFSILLVFYYTANFALLYTWGLGEATRGIVSQEADLFLDAYKTNNNAALPHSRSLHGYIGAENVPATIKKQFPPEQWDTWPRTNDGMLYRFVKNPDSESHHHLLIRDIPGSDKKLFMYYDVTVSDEKAREVWDRFRRLAIIGSIVTIALLVFFRYVILKAISPLGSLSEWISQIDEDHPPQSLPANIVNDEIGQAATRLYNALHRIYEHNKREKQFLRNASHELRTPIAIIRNALDVLEYKRGIGDDNIDPLIRRIRRAGDTMKSVTEAILWLAVEDYSSPVREKTDVKAIVKDLVEDNRHLIQEKEIQVKCELDKLEIIEVEGILLHIALDNLIRNAFQHCEQGEIHISARCERSIEIVNRMPAYSENTREHGGLNGMQTGHFGLGLALVNRITEKQGWRFSFKLEDDVAISVLNF